MSAETRPAVTEVVYELEDDKLYDECGVIGTIATRPDINVATITYDGLRRLQHRGTDAAGLVVNIDDTAALLGDVNLGRVPDALRQSAPREFTDDGHVRRQSYLDRSPGVTVAIGHVRYSTSKGLGSAQPFLGHEYREGGIAVGHNGHWPVYEPLARQYGLDPSQYTSDSHVLTAIIDKVAAGLGSVETALKEVLPQIEGAYCLTINDGERLYATRDPWGFHPLSYAKLPEDGGYMVASEPSAFRPAHAEFVRDVRPGELLIFDQDGTVTSMAIDRQAERMACMYEFIYTTKPYNHVDGISVYRARKTMGESLAADYPIDADIVVGVRESGTSAADGYAFASGLPKVEGLFKDDDARSYITDGNERDLILEHKQVPNEEELSGQRVVLVDDSLIKGNTMRAIVRSMKKAGAREVHVLIASPHFRKRCYMGMHTPSSELIADRLSDEEIAEYIGADSIHFLSVDRVQEALVAAAKTPEAALQAGKICTSCVTGKYPFQVELNVGPTRSSQQTELTTAAH